MNYFFSIIIPVYNVEKHLAKGVDSILNQTFSNFELLLINDGSNDSSGSICDYYSTLDDRVKVIHKKNGGASDARNIGVLNAKGDYVFFVDGDDYWDDIDALKKCFKHLSSTKGIDLLLFYWKHLNLKTNKKTIYKPKYNESLNVNYSKKEVVEMLFVNNAFPSSAILTVTRRDFIIDNKLFFVKGIKAEDIDWVMQVIINAKNINVLNLNFYVVLLNRVGSVTYSSDVKSIESILYILDKWVPSFINTKKEFSSFFLTHLAFHFSTCFITFPVLSISEKRKVLPKLKGYMFLLNFGKTRKIRLVKFMIQLFGVNVGSIILRFLYKVKGYIR